MKAFGIEYPISNLTAYWKAGFEKIAFKAILNV